MKRIAYNATFSMIVVAGLFVGMVKGKEVRHKWVAKMRNKGEEKSTILPSEINLDEFELATYHNS